MAERFVVVLNVILVNFGSRLNDICPQGDEALRLWEVVGEDKAVLAADIANFIETYDWFLTTTIPRIVIQPRTTTRAAEGPFFFHVTDMANMQSIRANGLEIRGGGNTSLQRKYPPRIHLARDLPAAFQFVNFQTAVALGLADVPGIKPKQLDQLEIMRVRHRTGRIYFIDPFYPIDGVYVTVRIPPEDLSPVRCWRATKRVYEFGSSHGWW